MRITGSYREGPKTERLLHRAFTTDDAAAFFALNGNPEVMKFTGEPVLTSLSEARSAIAAYPDFDTVGFGRWACVLRDTQRIVGFCGLKFLPDLQCVDVGFRFLPEFQGQGLATEACRASLEFGFRTLRLDQIIALVLPENIASQRVLKKCGMMCVGAIEYDGLHVHRYERSGV